MKNKKRNVSGGRRDRLVFAEDVDAIETIHCEPDESAADLPEALGKDLVAGICIDAIHSGDVVPREFRRSVQRAGGLEKVERRYRIEKDWGADYVAAALARGLGIESYERVNVARAILDFGRFPGASRAGATHVQRLAINRPFSECLSHVEKRRLLERYYDRISSRMDKAVRGRHLKISIHSYDRFNPSPYANGGLGTERPLISLVFGSHGYHNETQMPYGVFDEMFPDELGELTADRKLTARILLNVANAGFSVTHNHPYLLPEGSVEVRSQVWFFFRFLRRQFEEENPRTAKQAAFQMVWRMLLDTNLRQSDSELLRGYIHGHRRAPTGQSRIFREATEAYSAIEQFLDQRRSQLLDDYHFGSHSKRPSSLVVEVRKDFLWKFSDRDKTFRPKMGPEGLKRRNVETIAKLLRDAIVTYFESDL